MESSTKTICQNYDAAKEALFVKPKVSNLISEYLTQGIELHKLIDILGSPLNILFPEELHKNIESFRETLEHHLIPGKIFFTTKPNRSCAILREVACADVGVDVSSQGSLSAALCAGLSASKIESSGPKDKRYLLLSLYFPPFFGQLLFSNKLVSSPITPPRTACRA
jgi:diaminopimelate decarboxylase